MLRIVRLTAALALLAAFFISLAQAQSVRSEFLATPPVGPRRHKTNAEATTITTSFPRLKIRQSGILTSRLSVKERSQWKSIEALAKAVDQDGQPLHPTLHELLLWTENCGHAIYIEFHDSKILQVSTAGSFRIEQFDPAGVRHSLVLKLFLSSIDNALISPMTARPNGFIPFTDLKKTERYVEVLGHELAHLQYVLSSQLRAHLVHELVETTNEQLLLQVRQSSGKSITKDMRQRLTQRDQLLKDLEAQAEAVEEIVWQELLASKRTRHRRRR